MKQKLKYEKSYLFIFLQIDAFFKEFALKLFFRWKCHFLFSGVWWQRQQAFHLESQQQWLFSFGGGNS